VTYIAAGVCTVRADQVSNANWNAAARATATITLKRSQTVTITAPATGKVGATGTVTASTTATGLTVSVSVAPGTVCTRAGTTVTYVGVGDCTITATQAGNTNYYPGSATDTISVGKGDQTITFADPANTTMASSPVSVPATASSGLDVTLTPTDSTVCTVSGSTSPFSVNLLKPGTCTLTARQTGDADWSAATAVAQSFTIGKSDQTISATAPTTGSKGRTGAISYSTTSALTVTVASTTTSVCTVSGTTVTYKSWTGGQATRTCTLTFNQAGNANWNPAPQVSKNIAVS
jgi:hypothetical protein